MRKGITPIIAIIILLLITIALAGAAWSYLQNFLFSQISKSFIIPSGGAFCENGIIKIYLLNTGYQSVLMSPNDFIMAEVDGNSIIGGTGQTSYTGEDGKTYGLQSRILDQGQAGLVFTWQCYSADCSACVAQAPCKDPIRGYHTVRIGTTSTIIDPRISCT